MGLNWKGMTETIIVNTGINLLTGVVYSAIFAAPLVAYGIYTKWQLNRNSKKAVKTAQEILEEYDFTLFEDEPEKEETVKA